MKIKPLKPQTNRRMYLEEQLYVVRRIINEHLWVVLDDLNDKQKEKLKNLAGQLLWILDGMAFVERKWTMDEIVEKVKEEIK